MRVLNGQGKEVAEWKSPILSFHMGTTRITFLHPDRHLEAGPEPVTGVEAEHHEVEGEMVEVKPAGFGRRAEVRVFPFCFCVQEEEVV